MNIYFGFAIVVAVVFLFIVYMALRSADDFKGDSVKSFGIILTFLALLLVVFTAMGDGMAYQEQLDEQAARYENAMIDGTFKIGHNWNVEILNGDTTMLSDEPFVILLEN